VSEYLCARQPHARREEEVVEVLEHLARDHGRHGFALWRRILGQAREKVCELPHVWQKFLKSSHHQFA
jgi:hypothetical protein